MCSSIESHTENYKVLSLNRVIGMIKHTTSNKKYCKECAKEIDRQKAKERIKKFEECSIQPCLVSLDIGGLSDMA